MALAAPVLVSCVCAKASSLLTDVTQYDSTAQQLL